MYTYREAHIILYQRVYSHVIVCVEKPFHRSDKKIQGAVYFDIRTKLRVVCISFREFQ